MSTLEEIKAATAKLDLEEQVQLFRWWTSSEVFRTRQLASLKHEIALGLAQLERGQYRIYDEDSLMRLAEEVGSSGRKRLKARGNKPPA